MTSAFSDFLKGAHRDYFGTINRHFFRITTAFGLIVSEEKIFIEISEGPNHGVTLRAAKFFIKSAFYPLGSLTQPT